MAERSAREMLVTSLARSLAPSILILCVACAATTPAAAADSRVRRLGWSTYLRTGPGTTFTVLDELEHDTKVVVAGCTDRWCRVSADGLEGFVDRDALDLPHLPPTPAAVGAACIVAGQTDARRPRPTRFCGPATEAKARPAG